MTADESPLGLAGGPGLIVGVDVGGTFTDVFFLDEGANTARVAKVPTSRPDQSAGFLAGIGQHAADKASIATVVHGTTAGTNALLQRKGAQIGVITTEGFRDVLEMRRRDRPKTWGLWGQFEPIVPRDLRLEVPERTLADGTIHRPVEGAAVQAAARTLMDRGCQAVALLFVNAYANPSNERTAAAAVRALWPNDHVTASSEILPEIREFERFSTTALNAYLQPEVSGYLGRLEAALKREGFGGEFLIVQSNGGVMSVDTAKRRPVRTALSGPAAGVIAAGYIATEAGFPNIITGDMGGTSFDVSLIAGGRTVLSPQTSIDYGMVVRTPMIEITTIGAGGGSIASVDRAGMLTIGPESAGSNPGPVCYGKSNDRPTVTDANVVLGRINADQPIGGGLDRLDRAAAMRAIERHIGDPLDLDGLAAAEAIIRVANARMAGAIRLVSIERGFDPKRFALMPFGGGGALHVGALMQDVGLGKALVPRYPGVTSALGCVIADMRHDFVQTINATVPDVDVAQLATAIAAHAAEGQQLLADARATMEAVATLVEFDMAYVGQTHTVAVPFSAAVGPGGALQAFDRAAIASAFEATYQDAYGRLLTGGVPRILNLRTAVVGRRPKFDLSVLAPAGTGTAEAARRGTRAVFADGAWHDTPVFDRLPLPIGATLTGPAILQQPDTTIFIDPGLQGEVDRFGNLIISRTS